MEKVGKAMSPNNELTPTELGLIIDTAIHMDRYINRYDSVTEVQALLRNMKKKHFGIQLFLISNILNFNTAEWYKPEEIKHRFQSHVGLKTNTNDDLLTGNELSNRNGINSRDINKALNKLRGKADFKNVTGMKKIKIVTNQTMQFEGFPSIWKFPTTIDVIRSIVNKPKIFFTVYSTLLKSGLLYDYWRHTFVTFLGFLEEIDESDIQKCKLVLQNFFAAVPEQMKNKQSPEYYVQQLIALRNKVSRLSDSDLIKNAGKMAGYIIKNAPEFAVFGTRLETINKLKSGE